MQARNREFRRQNAERESGRPDFEVGKAGSNPVSAIEKKDTRKNLVSFFYALRPKKRCFTPIGRRCAKIKPDDLNILNTTTFLKYSDAIDSLFHTRTVLCESDSDC